MLIRSRPGAEAATDAATITETHTRTAVTWSHPQLYSVKSRTSDTSPIPGFADSVGRFGVSAESSETGVPGRPKEPGQLYCAPGLTSRLSALALTLLQRRDHLGDVG